MRFVDVKDLVPGALLAFDPEGKTMWPKNGRNLPSEIQGFSGDNCWSLKPPFVAVRRNATPVLLSTVTREIGTENGPVYAEVLVNTLKSGILVLWAPIDDLILL